MDGSKEPASQKLARVWTHTGTVVGFLAAVVTIIGFLGYKFNSSEKAKPPVVSNPPKVDPPPTSHKEEPPATKPGPVQKRGIGTIHIEGGFPLGQPMLTRDALAVGTSQSLKLTNPASGREETLENAQILAPVEAGQLAAVWHKGTQFVRGAKLVSETIHLSGNGVQIDAAVDAGGKLLEDLVWPANRMFTDVAFPGPVEVNGWSFKDGLTFGDQRTNESGKTLPVRFWIDVPKPGEVVDAIKGEATYPGGGKGPRYIYIEAISPTGSIAATWWGMMKLGGPTPIKPTRDGVLDQGLNGLRMLYSATEP